MDLLKQMNEEDRKIALKHYRPELNDLQFELLCRLVLEKHDEPWFRALKGGNNVERARRVIDDIETIYTPEEFDRDYNACLGELEQEYGEEEDFQNVRDQVINEIDGLSVYMSDGRVVFLFRPMHETILI
jgi:hypothetical protein